MHFSGMGWLGFGAFFSLSFSLSFCFSLSSVGISSGVHGAGPGAEEIGPCDPEYGVLRSWDLPFFSVDLLYFLRQEVM